MIEIKKATTNDIENLTKLLSILFSQEKDFTPDNEKQKHGLELIINHSNTGEILIAKQQNKTIGMVSLLYSISTALGSKVAILEDMIVHPDFRNLGIGNKLINEAIKTAKRNNCQRITLLTDNDNFDAHRFYEVNEFKKSKMVVFRRAL